MNYLEVCKHARKITDKVSDVRPILQGVYHKGNKIIATDGSRLLDIKMDKVHFDEHVYDMKRDKIVEEGTYPDVESIVKTPNHVVEVPIIDDEVKTIREMLKFAKSLKFKLIKIEQNDNKLILKPTDLIKDRQSREIEVKNLTIEFTLSNKMDNEKVDRNFFNIDYMIQAIDFILETKCGFNMLVPKEALHPLHFKNDELFKKEYTYVVLPVREH